MYVFQSHYSSLRPMMVSYRVHVRQHTVSGILSSASQSQVNIFLVCSVLFLVAMVAVLLYVLVLLYRYTNTPDPHTIMEARIAHDSRPHDVYVCPMKENMATLSRICDNHDTNVPPQIVMVPCTPPPEYRSLGHRAPVCGSPLPTYEELMVDSARSTRTLMTIDDVEMKDVSAVAEEAPPPEPFETISILQLVKEAQQQHGLRHGDYNRYRVYCCDKLRRVRSALKVTNTHKCMKRHKAKFAKKPIAVEAFGDIKYIQLPLFEVERRWAQAMNCKTALEDNPTSRQRHAMRNSLKKAVQHVAILESLVKASPRCDAPTKLECQAYSLWLKGIVAFELREWSTASEHLAAAKVIYERLAEATPNSVLANLYSGKCREIQPQLRLCEFNSGEAPKASMSELMKLKEEMGTDSDSIDHLIAEMRLAAKTDDSIPIEWAGVTAPAGDEKKWLRYWVVEEVSASAGDEKVRAIVVAWSQTDKELAECKEPKEKMALLEKQIADTRDVIEKLNESQKRKAAEGATGLDASEAVRLRGYLDYVRLSRTAERYLAIIENTKLEKKHKPQDLLRLYDSVIEILKEVTEVDGSDNKELQSGYRTRIEYYRTFRCHYMACAYSSLGRYSEAAALFERALERATRAEKDMKAAKGNKYIIENVSSLTALRADVERALVTAKAERLAAAARGADEGGETKKAEEMNERPLCDTMDEWRSWPQLAAAAAGGAAGAAAAAGGAKGKKKTIEGAPLIPIAALPPALLPMPVKPMFFDLAASYIQLPDLRERMAALEKDEKKDSTPSKSSGKKGASSSTASAAAAAPAEEDQGILGKAKGLLGFWGK
ncbi:srpa-68 [Pristionchus pacificus]|uniref:Signal recognition particle subunit SRP68 n=1 Tax=Pristionchus pacificus TaxID=54126 RepID=A0A2A6CSX7_PRIPA|nr:srpa-68 [Pristionchus pacificus]|eukprot:PDM81324.1 srpa-68 [Pristionchus pacificus]